MFDAASTWLPGTPKEELDTPAFVVDLDAMERNIRRMADYFAERPVNLRPHSKHHKTPAIARKQLDAGAIGVCCQKLGEAEVMVDAGIPDVLVTYQLWGAAKLRRLMSLARRADVKVIVDDARNVDHLSEAAQAFGVTLGVLVEVNTGHNRTGVDPGGPAIALAKAVAASPGLALRGLHGYAGHVQAIPDEEERAEKDRAAMAPFLETVELLQREGLEVDIVTGGGTGTYKTAGNYPGMTELQAGSYVFMDAQYRRATTDFEVSGTILATVMSRVAEDRAVLDAGMKAVSTDQWPPLFPGMEGVEASKASDEHMVLTLTDSDARQLRAGDKIELVPGHNDTTVNLHSHLFAVRNGALETVWETAARGRIR